MVLRCSLLGHDYGESEVEREREERGSEVVVTVQEYEECVRCGDRHVISENTEVTSLSAAPATETEPGTTETAAPDSETTSTPDPDLSDDVSIPSDDSPTHATADSSTTEIDEADGVTDDGLIIDDEPDAETVESGPQPERGDADVVGDDGDTDGEYGKHGEHRDHRDHSDEFDIPTDEDGNPVTDDGEILEDEPADAHADRESDREHGEWPDSDDVGPPVDDAEAEHSEWPDTGEQVDDDAVVLEHDSTAYEDESAVDARTATVDSTEHTQFEGMAEADDEHPAAAAGESTASWASGSEASGDSSSSVEAGADTAPESETAGAGSGIERVGDAPVPGDADHPGDDVPSEFYCPRCEFVATSDRGSLRAGDICPDCRKGYLGERARQ
ncbi:hypothetical protein C482_06162 [Natrialba chahannaoensis JCM 10990]|uniref:Uncharacterized protein n=1 Tax=Natrialba chahannaoensis JCM 10990 TaxID=1227492 RepID=M0AUJ8_9EURY|nr:hypothetical protein [Natrialba chahannaoensis]ELZ01613.1 hypothetical protein C482_06162 [Natrialba chahannaoensis JCM 10990]